MFVCGDNKFIVFVKVEQTVSALRVDGMRVFCWSEKLPHVAHTLSPVQPSETVDEEAKGQIDLNNNHRFVRL